MDRATESERTVPMATAAADSGENHRQRRSVRRRLVQSTLFPHKGPEIVETNREQNGCGGGGDKECNGVEEGDDGQEEEYCFGSQGKKRRTRKGKLTPQTKPPKKLKSPANATPKKNAMSNRRATERLEENGGESQAIPNLRLEAKLTAEENSRIFAGKQLHPFFSSWKVGKRNQETAEAESNFSLAQKINKSTTIGPIHVFEKDEENAISLDWRNWKFCERSLTNTSCSFEGPFLSIFEGFVESFNKFSSVSHPSGTSLVQDNMFWDQCIFQQEVLPEASATISAMSSDVPVACFELVKDSETDCEVYEVGPSSGTQRKSNTGQQSEFLQERIKSYCLDCADRFEDRLWTDKYQPKKALEVCGNDESVKFLSEWLHSWHERGHQASKDSYGGDECYMEDSDYNCFQSNSDSENINEGASLKNILLITGPVGSGKSAAIYACAKEQGFRVLEANASASRNGAVVKQSLGEALASHSLEWSQENRVESHPNGKMTQESDNELIEVIPIADEDNSQGASEASGKLACKDNSFVYDQGQLKHLILFEDVDIAFPEDRGFTAAIQKIAEKAKGPVILTSNSHNPILPNNLEVLKLCFTMPSKKELLQHVSIVCSAEKANIQPYIIEQLIDYCRGDIRKTIMHLQFWGQGKAFGKGKEVQKLFSPLLFDPEAWHQVLPKVIPWDFPSQLSELVEKEITMSLSMMEENSTFMEVTEGEFDKKGMHIHETESIEAKKEKMLSRNYSGHDWNGLTTPFDAACDFFNVSGTPVSFSRRNRRRKHDVVMSSDSEDEYHNDRFPKTLEKENNHELFLQIDGRFPSHYTSMQNCLSPSNGTQLCSEAVNLDSENYYQCSEMATGFHLNDTCKSFDVSCVPESSFVPETEINDGTELFFTGMSCGQVADALEEVSVSNESKQNLLPIEAEYPNKSISKAQKASNLLEGICDANEEEEDSQNEHVEAVTRVYPVMDECSCMDFKRKLKPVKKLRFNAVTDLVRETWRKLHDHHTDLRHVVSSEHKDAFGIIKLTHDMSNLISEAELLLSKCQPLDSLELSLVLSEALDAFYWCNEQLQMASTIAQHGFCSYCKDAAAFGLKMDFKNMVDLGWEILPATSMRAVGQDMSSCKTSLSGLGTEMNLQESGTLLNSEMRSCLFDIIQSIVPSRSYMTMKGDAFHEYRSSLGQISRSEASQLSECISMTKRRRARAARNYLSTGSLMLSPEEISLLGQSNICGNNSFQSTDTNIR